MEVAGNQDVMIAQAVAGDAAALESLLLIHHDRLIAWIAQRLPQGLNGPVSPEDVAQETYVQAFRDIGGFVPQHNDAFLNWLRAIAENRLRDMLRAATCKKRGGGWGRIDPASSESVVLLLEQLAVSDKTPSRSVALREGESAIRVALAGLKDDYRQAIELRYLRGLSVAEAAQLMGRTEDAISMLCHRAMAQLRASLGRASAWLSSK